MSDRCVRRLDGTLLRTELAIVEGQYFEVLARRGRLEVGGVRPVEIGAVLTPREAEVLAHPRLRLHVVTSRGRAGLLAREGKRYALATQCIGGGQGIATVLKKPGLHRGR